MKLLKIVKKETYKKSKNHVSYFALQLVNGKIVPIKPVFNSAYPVLNALTDKTIYSGFKNETKKVS